MAQPLPASLFNVWYQCMLVRPPDYKLMQGQNSPLTQQVEGHCNSTLANSCLSAVSTHTQGEKAFQTASKAFPPLTASEILIIFILFFLKSSSA